MNLDDLDLKFQEIADSRVLSFQDKIGSAISMIYKQVAKPLVLPKIFQIKGEVEVTKQAPVEVRNLSELKKYFESLETTFNKMMLAIQAMPQPQVKLPKFEIPTQIKADNPELVALLEKLNEKIDSLQPAKAISMSRTNDLLESLVNRPQMVPQPVTNIWLNPSEGFMKTSDNTVGTTVVTLPNYGQLFNRRTVLVYNNSANTIYIGGSDVTTSNGFPVSGNNYGPPIDAGYNLPVYAIASQGGNDVRVIEISKDKSGTVQE
ncbi:MAG: hypothetical protein C5B43_02300 [Verrucomicrobia bacterium]|nr:MAG: hypothetical protein C5B43_02300 [Verrucomicrobiota bacterium]